MANADEIKRQNEMDNLNLLRQQNLELTAMVERLRNYINFDVERQNMAEFNKIMDETQSQALPAHDNAIRAEVAEECERHCEKIAEVYEKDFSRTQDMYYQGMVLAAMVCKDDIRNRVARKYKEG